MIKTIQMFNIRDNINDLEELCKLKGMSELTIYTLTDILLEFRKNFDYYKNREFAIAQEYGKIDINGRISFENNENFVLWREKINELLFMNIEINIRNPIEFEEMTKLVGITPAMLTNLIWLWEKE